MHADRLIDKTIFVSFNFSIFKIYQFCEFDQAHMFAVTFKIFVEPWVNLRQKCLKIHYSYMYEKNYLRLITVDGYAALFNCAPVDRVSDSMMAPT